MLTFEALNSSTCRRSKTVPERNALCPVRLSISRDNFATGRISLTAQLKKPKFKYEKDIPLHLERKLQEQEFI